MKKIESKPVFMEEEYRKFKAEFSKSIKEDIEKIKQQRVECQKKNEFAPIKKYIDKEIEKMKEEVLKEVLKELKPSQRPAWTYP
jgi:hypothetical protein